MRQWQASHVQAAERDNPRQKQVPRRGIHGARVRLLMAVVANDVVPQRQPVTGWQRQSGDQRNLTQRGQTVHAGTVFLKLRFPWGTVAALPKT